MPFQPITKKATLLATLMFTLAFLLIGWQPLSAQGNYDWWNRKHNWDGVTHWTNYLIYTPGYMGPNALPVPRLHNALLSSMAGIEPGVAFHIQPGELTMDGNLRIYYPFAKGLAALEISQTTLECYKTDTLLRDERRARSQEVKGFATGDINVTCYFTLVRNNRWPDMVLRINLRTPSGTQLADARFTDSPGYFFDVTMGKTLTSKQNSVQYRLRFYAMFGFYAWQTGFAYNRQDDALLFGAGSQLTMQKHCFSAEISGYLGYMQLRDDPVVARAIYEYHTGNKALRLQYQKGLNDIYHHSVHGSVVFFLRPWQQP